MVKEDLVDDKISLILGDNLIKKREIIHMTGAQVFFSDKNEVIMRKSPNLVMSPYECLRQLKIIYSHMENLRTAAAFFEDIIKNWDTHTKEISDNPA